MMRGATVSSMPRIGTNGSNPILMPSEQASSQLTETLSAKPSSSLKSLVKPHEILEKGPAEPKRLRISKEDFAALCQVIEEFKEQVILP